MHTDQRARARRSLSRRLGSALAPAAIAAMLAVPGFAQATAASASAASARPSFAAQARGYGLSSAQVSTLQREVNSYIAQHGGTQVAINEVAFTGGRTLFAVPGQKYSRPVTSAATARPSITSDCPPRYFCLYQKQNFGGHQQDFGQCKEEFNSDGYDGSYKNDQTPPLNAQLYIENKETQKKTSVPTCDAWCEDSDYPSNASTILDVTPC
jgi:Peptidase inhibitor family I36